METPRTRWRLQRHELFGIVLVVELAEPSPARGYMHKVTDRAHARRLLVQMRPMVERIGPRVLTLEDLKPTYRFDPIEEDAA